MAPFTSLFPLLWTLFFACDCSEQEGWIRASLLPLRMMARPVQHFRSAIFSAWQDIVAAELSNRKRFSWDVWTRHVWVSSTSCLFPPEGKRQNVVESHAFWGEFGMVFT